jgi:hypothetical protein
MNQGELDKEIGRQGDTETDGRSLHFSLSPPLLVSLSTICGGAAAAVTLGWVAAKLNVSGFAPVGLLPLGIGIALGASVCGLVGRGGVPRWSRLVIGTTAFGILAALAEHAWLYRDFCRQWREARAGQTQLAMFRPETPWSATEYFAREATPGHVALWCADAAILVAAAVGVVVWRRMHSQSVSQTTEFAEKRPT